MVPKPAKNFQQTQPITTGLRIICESYPAGTCLRELLQNADDARATEIEFVLDTKSYKNGPLLSEALWEFHGPAILTRNNSVFTDEDFESISSVGDSRKRDDASTTGKFGLGFNSVYHWTDGPSILSRNWLLIFDPHQQWSDTIKNPGGPTWDIIQNCSSVEIQNQLQTFGAFRLDMSKEIDQTIIRIPLRTQAQAKTSKIVPREITVDEITKALEEFAQEMKEGGLLFLKYVSKIILRVNEDVLANIQIEGNEPNDLRVRGELPFDFIRLYKPHGTLEVPQVLSKNFELKIEYTMRTVVTYQRWLLQHTMMSTSGDQALDDWARPRKLFAWTAVAARLSDTSTDTAFHGQLFSTLRLPIFTNQPVHVHGLWSISPDRGRLSSSGQSTRYEDLGTKWNEFMFRRCASTAWASLLLHRKKVSWNKERFNLWPNITSTPTEVWQRLIGWVLDEIIIKNLPVWNSGSGCVALSEGFFARTSSETQKYALVFNQIYLPTIFLTDELLYIIRWQAKCLSTHIAFVQPAVVRGFLKQTRASIPSDASLLLEYCLLDGFTSSLNTSAKKELYRDLQDIAIWPNLGGSLSILQNLLLPRDVEEMNIFLKARESQTIDFSRLTAPVREVLLRDIDIVPSMRHRVLSDLQQDWQFIYPVMGELRPADTLSLRCLNLDSALSAIWGWISERAQEDNPDFAALDDLWLFPVNGTYLRRYAPRFEPPLMLVVDKSESLYKLMVNISSDKKSTTAPLLDTYVLPAEAIRLLRKQIPVESRIAGACLEHLESCVAWLVASEKGVTEVTTGEKALLLQHLELLVRSTSPIKQWPEIRSHIRCLPLYSKVQSEAPFNEWSIIKSNLSGYHNAVELPEGLPPLPNMQSISFYNLTDRTERFLVNYFNLIEKMSMETLLETFLLPWAISAHEIFSTAKNSLIDFIFRLDISRNPSDAWKMIISSQAIVPLDSGSSENPKCYSCLRSIVSPGSSLSKLYFENENVFPDTTFFENHMAALIPLGIRREPIWPDVVDRIKCFSTRTANELAEKVGYLLSLSTSAHFMLDPSTVNFIRTLKWIPGIPPGGNSTSLLSPDECHSAEWSSHTDLVLGTTRFSPSGMWRRLLGWDIAIERDVLLRQLDLCLAQNLYSKVNCVLNHISPNDYSALLTRPCILGTHKNYRNPQRTFLPKSLLTTYPMSPFLDEVDLFFEESHPALLKALNVRSQPSLKDISDVQRTMQASTEVLNPDDLGVIISSLEIATQLYKTSDLTDMLVPDSQNILRNLSDIVHGDRNVTGAVATFNFTHPAISSRIIQSLGVENCLARATRLEIDFDDEDEDEYTPRETLSTAISDTLQRYSIASTFNEYLANAEDCGATKISWILDECQEGHHASSTLLTEELKLLQGPALMVHNDGVFSDKDFNGFKDIGRGSKGDDATTIGMFGRGAMSMFHFTDVPMIVSGAWFLVLDPQQESLPKNRHFKRKLGVKIPLSMARKICKDQLAPFHGICGYSDEVHSYTGTIFRFPFRSPFTTTTLHKSQKKISLASRNTNIQSGKIVIDSTKTRELLLEYFENAPMALLFLRNVNSISFSVRGEPQFRWFVFATRPEGSNNETFGQVTVTSSQDDEKQIERVWRVGLMDVHTCPPGVSKPGRAAGKLTTCGVAACISGPRAVQRVFCRLPTDFVSTLPISFHASFGITGDRQSIPFEDFHKDSVIAGWNRWLLETCIPDFYLEFLIDLAPKVGESSFALWPISSKHGLSNSLSDVVISSFWRKVMDEEHRRRPFYPVCESTLMPRYFSTLISKPGRSGKFARTVSANLAHFDFLPRSISSKLLPLFLGICHGLVRLPEELWPDMQRSQADGKCTVLNPTNICQLFRQEGNYKFLVGFLAEMKEDSRVEAIEMLLQSAVPLSLEDPANLGILDGCRILPRLDGSLGLLKLNPEADSEWTFHATEIEQKLFAFASCLFVDRVFQQSSPGPTFLMQSSAERVSRNPIREIMTAPFNVRPLALQDIGGLLARSESPTTSSLDAKRRTGWTHELWKYLDTKIKEELRAKSNDEDLQSIIELLAGCGLLNQPIYLIKYFQPDSYITYTQFEAEPYILDPMDEQQHELCMEIKDLRLIDHACAPSQLSKAENNLKDRPSFSRLLKALLMIEKQRSVSISNYLAKELTSKSVKTLRNLLIHYVNSTASNIQYMHVLRALPVWPHLGASISDSSKYLPAKTAYFCRHNLMLMPWIKDLENFVKPEILDSSKNFLSNINVHFLSIEQIWDYVKDGLPKFLDTAGLEEYVGFVHCLAQSSVRTGWYKLAPNGAGELCHASSLFDHEEPIFLAAFREEEPTRYLNLKLRGPSLKSFWVFNGLRTNHSARGLTAEDYLLCAVAIERRWLNKTLSQTFCQDAQIVASYLRWDKDVQSWPQITWNSLCKIHMFRVIDEFSGERAYRRNQMHQIAQRQSYRCLEDIAQDKYKPILWSQSTFSHEPPADFVFKQLPNWGLPSVVEVFNHVQFLISICTDIGPDDMVDYFKDIQASYTYLQVNQAHVQLIPGIRDVSLWINLDTTDITAISARDIERNILPAKSLCLNCPTDPLPLKVARKFLVPYEMLLKALGCESIVQPTIPISLTSDSEPPMTAALKKMRDLRDKGHLVDVIFVAEGFEKPAHKIFMAAVSSYCEAQFLGEWGRILQHPAKIMIRDMRFRTLCQMVDFAYMGVVEWANVQDPNDNDEVATKLDELLDLLQGTDRWFLGRLHEKAEDHIMSHSKVFVRPDNVLDVKEIAEGARALRLVTHCEAFIEANRGFVAALSRM